MIANFFGIFKTGADCFFMHRSETSVLHVYYNKKSARCKYFFICPALLARVCTPPKIARELFARRTRRRAA